MFLWHHNINKKKRSPWLLSDHKVSWNWMLIEVFKRWYGEKYQFVWSFFVDEIGSWTKWTGYFLGLFKLVGKIKFWAAQLQ